MVDPDSKKMAGPQSVNRRRRRDRSRGAVLIEAAMVFPLLILLTFGAVEYGFIFRDELKLTTAARSGARIGTADKNPAGTAVNADDDYQILQAIYSALGSYSSQVTYVSIYDAGTNANGAPPALCTGAGASSQSNCDVWAASDFTSSAATIEASLKYKWTVASRLLALNTNSNNEPTYLGVEIQATHHYLTGLFGSSRLVTERAIFRFEPNGNTSHSNFIPFVTTTTAPTTTAGPTTTGGPTTTAPPTTTTTTTQPTTTTTTQPTTTTSHGPTTTHAPTTSTTHGPTTTHAPTTTGAPTTTSPPTTVGPTTTTNITIIPT